MSAFTKEIIDGLLNAAGHRTPGKWRVDNDDVECVALYASADDQAPTLIAECDIGQMSAQERSAWGTVQDVFYGG